MPVKLSNMSTLLVAAIIIGSVAIICLILFSIHNKHNREAMNKLLKHFSQLGTENNLSFSSQEILKNGILGLDGLRRKLVAVTREGNSFGSLVIDLNQVKICAVKKIYGTIHAGDLKTRKLDQYLEKIILQFDFENRPSLEIPFYQHLHNHLLEAAELEQKARHWETILSKMKTEIKLIAQPVPSESRARQSYPGKIKR
jgi:hypothetical protein